MIEPEQKLDPVWREALTEALDDPRSASQKLQLFFETRVDLAVEASSRTGCSRVLTRHCGLSAAASPGGSGVEHRIHVSDPGLEDVQRLARAAPEPLRSPTPRPSGAGSAHFPVLSDPGAADWIERAHGEIARLAPTAQAHSRWVQFDQHILSGAFDRPVVADRRRGCRIRVQAWIEGKCPSSAVSEAVFRPRHQNSADLTGPAPEDLARRLVERLHRRTRARHPKTGSCTAVLGPGAGGVLVHEIVGHALEADTAHRGSWLTAASAPVAPEDLNVLDDPRRGRAPWCFDDEGQAAGVTPLIGGGQIRSWLCDRSAARRTGRRPTGHGRRASFREPVRPRMGCTFVAPGRLAPEEVTARVDGIYVRRMEAASVDTESGRAIFRVTDADALTRGCIEAPLRVHLLCVDASEALAGIDRVADDLTFDTSIGSCQRDGQSLAISVGAPTIRIGLATVIA